MSVHVIHRGNNRGSIFRDDVDYVVFLAMLQAAADRYGLAVHVYVLMTNHYHLIVTPSDACALPQAMKALGVRYVLYFNRKYKRVGTLLSGRYRALSICDERYWLTCLRYIEQNPVRAGMVENAGAYRWSSYGVHALGKGQDWLQPHRVYLSLGGNPDERQSAYRALCADPVRDAQLIEQRLGTGSLQHQTGIRI
jgi:putative transposase